MNKGFYDALVWFGLALGFLGLASCGSGPEDPQGLVRAPGATWEYWSDGDSITTNGVAFVSQSKYSGKQSMVTDTALRAWSIGAVRDSLDAIYLDDTDDQTLSWSPTLNRLTIANGNSATIEIFSDLKVENTNDATLYLEGGNGDRSQIYFDIGFDGQFLEGWRMGIIDVSEDFVITNNSNTVKFEIDQATEEIFLRDDVTITGRLTVGSSDIVSGSGSPEGSVTAPPGSLFMDSGGALYVKTSGTGNTGWTLK